MAEITKPVEPTEDVPDEKPEAPEGFMSLDEVKEKYLPKDYIKRELSRRTKDLVKPDALLDDESFREKALAHWQIPATPEEKAPPQDEGKLRAQIAKEIETKRVKPLEEEVGKLRTLEQRRRRDKLVGKIIAAAAKADIHGELYEEGDAGEQAPIVAMVEGLYGYDEATDDWFRKDGDSFQPSATGGYKSVAEGLADWVKGKGKPAWLVRDQRQQGAGLKKPGVSGNGSIKSRADFKSDAEKVAFIREHGREKFEQLPAK